MSKKETKELVKLSDGELEKELGSCREGLYKFRFQKVVEEIADVTMIRRTKRRIARIKTMLSERKRKQGSDANKAEAPAKS